MKPLSRRSVTTGMVAAVTAIPALVVARSDPLERVKHHTRELEEAMREAYGVEVETIAFHKTDDMKRMVFVVAHTLTSGGRERNRLRVRRQS